MNKQFKTIHEQIELLESRGLLIPDKQRAFNFLRTNNYYRISGYSLTLRNNDIFSPNASFQNIIDIYEFDHEMRHIILKYIELIEIKLKSTFAHEFSRVYGPTEYTDSSLFSDPDKHAEIIAKSERLKEQRTPHEAYLKHFISDLHTKVPIWAYVELFSIADISILYKISPENLKIEIAKNFNLEENKYQLLERFMHSMTIIRNLCAHGSRLFNRLFEQKPNLSKAEKALLRQRENGTIDNEHLFSFIIIMKRLLSKNDFRAFKKELDNLSKKYPFVRLDYYGFPNNWIRKI